VVGCPELKATTDALTVCIRNTAIFAGCSTKIRASADPMLEMLDTLAKIDILIKK
jgi:hypothetical protein